MKYKVTDGTNTETFIEADTSTEAMEKAFTLKHAPCKVVEVKKRKRKPKKENET